jgi:hypothetical protein
MIFVEKPSITKIHTPMNRTIERLYTKRFANGTIPVAGDSSPQR